jgi:hypothetical protein
MTFDFASPAGPSFTPIFADAGRAQAYAQAHVQRAPPP